MRFFHEKLTPCVHFIPHHMKSLPPEFFYTFYDVEKLTPYVRFFFIPYHEKFTLHVRFLSPPPPLWKVDSQCVVLFNPHFFKFNPMCNLLLVSNIKIRKFKLPKSGVQIKYRWEQGCQCLFWQMGFNFHFVTGIVSYNLMIIELNLN